MSSLAEIVYTQICGAVFQLNHPKDLDVYEVELAGGLREREGKHDNAHYIYIREKGLASHKR